MFVFSLIVHLKTLGYIDCRECCLKLHSQYWNKQTTKILYLFNIHLKESFSWGSSSGADSSGKSSSPSSLNTFPATNLGFSTKWSIFLLAPKSSSKSKLLFPSFFLDTFFLNWISFCSSSSSSSSSNSSNSFSSSYSLKFCIV